MKTLYESIINSINSDKKTMFKSFNIKDIGVANPNIKLNKILNIKKMKDYIASNSDIIVLSKDNDAKVFAKFLCTIEFTTTEWDILKNAPNPEDVDLLLKNKLKPFIKEKTINDYSFVVDEEHILIGVENGVRPKELINDYMDITPIIWFNDNFEF